MGWLCIPIERPQSKADYRRRHDRFRFSFLEKGIPMCCHGASHIMSSSCGISIFQNDDYESPPFSYLESEDLSVFTAFPRKKHRAGFSVK